MKKIGLFVLFLIMITLIACQNNKTIKIGVVGTMSGPNSELAVSGRRGVEVFVEEINSKGGINGRKIELIVKDDENDPIRAAEIVKEFEAEGVEIVIGHYTSGMMFAAYDTLLESDLLYLAPTVSADSLSNTDDNLMRFIASTKEQANVLGEFSQKSNYKTFGILMDRNNNGFNTALSENFKNEINSINREIVLELDFDSLNEESVAEIVKAVYKIIPPLDVLFIIASAKDLTTIDQSLHRAGIDLTIYGALWSHTTDLLRLGGTFIQNDYFVSGIKLDSKSEAFQSFEKNYLERYGEKVNFSAMYSYETMFAIKEAIEFGNSTDWETVKESIIKIESFNGLQDVFRVNKYGDNTRKYTIDTIKNGQYKRVYED